MKLIIGLLLVATTAAIAQLPQDQIFRMNNPAVFMLTATQSDGSQSISTAFCIRQDGVLATTWNTLADAKSAMVRSIYDKDIRVVGVLAYDAEHNLAIIKVDDGGLSEVQLGQSTYTTANELVFIIGDSAPSVNRMVLAKISADYKKAKEVEEYQLVIPVGGPFTARDNGSPILSGSGGRAIGIALATDPIPGAEDARRTAVVIPIEDLRVVMKKLSTSTSPTPLSPHGPYLRSTYGHYWAGRLHEVNGDRIDASEHYKLVLQSDPKNVGAAFQYAYVLEAQGQHDEAKQAYQKVIALAPKEDKALFNLGLIEYAEGKFVDAERHFAAAGSLNAKFFKAFDRLGMTQEQLKQPDAAVASYTKARDAKETDPYANLRIAHILHDQQKWSNAAAAAKKAREAGVDSTDVYLIEADSYAHSHSYLQAWDLAHRGTERNPKIARFWAIMTESSSKTNNPDRAKQEMTTLEGLDPEMAKQTQADIAAPK